MIEAKYYSHDSGWFSCGQKACTILNMLAYVAHQGKFKEEAQDKKERLMPDIRDFQIATYQVVLRRNVLRIDGKDYDRVALINCLGPHQPTDEVKWLNINFLDTESDVPANTTRRVGAQYIVNIYYQASYYAWFIDLLRNEETTYLQFSPTEPKFNRLRTGSEPIGEGED